MNNLVLVRHGQSKWNKERRFTGWADIDLTEQGKVEANYAGKLIKKLNIDFDEYFTSELKRAKDTLNIISKILNKKNVKITKAWELNERHYGNLTSLNKDEIIKKLGANQVQIWRRSYDISPPPISLEHPFINKIYKNSSISKIPTGESLKETYERVVPYYEKKIKPLISSNKNILIVFHGNSCRSLLKKILNISNEKIIKLEVPTGNPLLIKFNNSEVKKYTYLDETRAKKIFFNT